MLNRSAQRLGAGILAAVLSSSGLAHAQAREPVLSDATDDKDSPAIVVTFRDPAPRPLPVAEWKIGDISRARWIAKDAKDTSAPKAQATKKSHRGLAVMLIAIGGAVAGGYFGSIVQGSLCECDDQRITGAAYGALIGGATAGLVTYGIMR